MAVILRPKFPFPPFPAHLPPQNPLFFPPFFGRASSAYRPIAWPFPPAFPLALPTPANFPPRLLFPRGWLFVPTPGPFFFPVRCARGKNPPFLPLFSGPAPGNLGGGPCQGGPPRPGGGASPHQREAERATAHPPQGGPRPPGPGAGVFPPGAPPPADE